MSASATSVMDSVQRDTQAALAKVPPPGQDPAAILSAKEGAIAPLQAKETAAQADLTATPQPKPAALPETPQKPLVDPKDYQQFSYALLAMGLIAGSVGRGKWMGVSSVMNGAMKGFLEGNKQQAEENWKRFQADYDKAVQAHKDQEEDYAQTINNKKLTINQMLAEIQWKAAKYDDQYKLALARDKLVDELHKQVFDMAKQREELDLRKKAVDNAINASKPPEGGAASGGTGMALSGAPLNTIVPGYGKAAAAQRTQIRDAAIKQISEEMGTSEEEAGMELARRQVEYAAGKVSTAQLTKMEGATRQASAQLEFNVKKAKEEMAKLPSSDLSPVINAIARGEEQWTGDPAYSGLYFFMNAVATESARLLSGGQASAAQLHQGAAEEAQKWANINMTPASFNEVAEGMLAEGKERIKTYQDAIKAGQGNFSPTGSAPASTHKPFDDPAKEARYQEWKKANAGAQ